MTDDEDCICGIEVDRDPDGAYRLSWDARFSAGPVDVRAAPDPAALDGSGPPVVRGALGAARVAGLAPDRRHYFALESADGATLTVAERGVPLARGVNFRDLGGYLAAGGGRVRWGRLFRSGHLSHLTEDDRARVAALGIRTVCDLRLPAELANESAELPGDPEVEVIGIPPGIRDPRYLHAIFDNAEGPEPVIEAMHRLIAAIAVEAASEYRRLFEVLLEGRPGPLLVNCSAGKERTGIGVAWLLLALGVPRATIEYDFMLSLRYFPVEPELERAFVKYEVRRRPGDREIVMPLLETRASYLRAAFDAAERRWGSAEAMLSEAFGLGDAERARLRSLYLE